MRLTTKEKIEMNALKCFSEQGYYESSISSIAKRAKVSEATIFRLFNNKQELYLSVIKKYAKIETLQPHEILPFLTFDDLYSDFKVLSKACFKAYFDSIHIIRISISNIIQVPELRNIGYLIIPSVHDFVMAYLMEMKLREKIADIDLDLFVKVYLSTIFKDVALLTTFRKVEILNEEIEAELQSKWEEKIKFLVETFLIN